MKLYFIALIPPPQIRAEVKGFKEEMKVSYQASHALKSPAHITLQMPFKKDEEEENKLDEGLAEWAAAQSSFSIRVNGFDHFSDRVIYVRVEEHQPVIQLHQSLKKMLTLTLGFKAEELNKKMHPHMTIATRDLKPEQFVQAWQQFQNKKYEAQFDAHSIFLLKHNGKYWDIYREFTFGG